MEVDTGAARSSVRGTGLARPVSDHAARSRRGPGVTVSISVRTMVLRMAFLALSLVVLSLYTRSDG